MYVFPSPCPSDSHRLTAVVVKYGGLGLPAASLAPATISTFLKVMNLLQLLIERH